MEGWKEKKDLGICFDCRMKMRHQCETSKKMADLAPEYIEKEVFSKGREV